MELTIVATKADTGKAAYFTKADIKQDDYSTPKASCAIPFTCHPYKVNDIEYFDGALSDPVPVQKALNNNADKIVLILTKPLDIPRNNKKVIKIASMIRRKYPASAQKPIDRALTYNKAIEKAKQDPRILIIDPDDTLGVDTLCQDAEAMKKFYQKGYEDDKAVISFLK